MKIKFSKNKKIILLITGLGILTTSIVTPIVVINNKNKDNKQSIVDSNTKQNSKDLKKVNEIIAKIKDKDILIAPNVSTQNQSEIQNAIKNQLKKENQTLSEDDLSKITINNIVSLTLGSQIEVTLNINVRSIIKELKINVEKINLLKNSNIDDGGFGDIFQDSFGNLWAMGNGKPLQVLKAKLDGNGYVTTGWTNNTTKGLTNGSNIIDGVAGTIFQDSFGNLWTMGWKQKLQVLKVNSIGNGYVTTGWTDDNNQGLLNASNIIHNQLGTIFQDSFGNLWAMGKGTPLQVLKAKLDGNGYVTTGWTNNTTKGLTNGSNIIDGYSGKIFQDSFGNLWAMGNGKPLQVLKAKLDGNGYVTTGWTNNTTKGLTNGSNIIDGVAGTIFQDKFKNLWAMGNKTPLQVLKAKLDGNGYVTTGWDNVTTQGLLKNSNIHNGLSGTIFQDSFGNLWALGRSSKLQVLKANLNGNGYVTTGWIDATTERILKGSNINKGSNVNNGFHGTIFQDSFKNLWTTESNKPLQVLKADSNGNGYVTTGWTNNTTNGLTNGSNIIDGYSGKIFQDSFGNLWAMGKLTSLQVLIANSNNNDYLNSWL